MPLRGFPVLDFSDRQAKRLQHALDVDALLIEWERVEPRNSELEARLKELKQRGIDDGFIVVPGQAKA